jgi:hypothetical protein
MKNQRPEIRTPVAPDATAGIKGGAGVFVLLTACKYRRLPKLRPFTHVGSSLENMRRDLVAQWQAQ